MARRRGWRVVLGCAMGAVVAWGILVGRRWLRRRYRGREHLRRAYTDPRAFARDFASFWHAPVRLTRLRHGLSSERRLLAQLALVAVRASQCTSLWPLVDRLVAWLGLSEQEMARLSASDLAAVEVAQVQAVLFAVRYGEQMGELEDDLLSELHEAYGRARVRLVLDWLALVRIVVRVGYTWELALSRLSGAAAGSALLPLAIVGLALFGGLPLLFWALVVRATVSAGETATSSA